jgi:hypothetical protein
MNSTYTVPKRSELDSLIEMVHTYRQANIFLVCAKRNASGTCVSFLVKVGKFVSLIALLKSSEICGTG